MAPRLPCGGTYHISLRLKLGGAATSSLESQSGPFIRGFLKLVGCNPQVNTIAIWSQLQLYGQFPFVKRDFKKIGLIIILEDTSQYHVFNSLFSG